MPTVADLKNQVIEAGLAVADEKGVYHMPNGALVSKAKKADLEALLGAPHDLPPVAPPMESTLPVVTAKGIVPESTKFNDRIKRCLERAEAAEQAKGMRWKRRARYWRAQAKNLAG